MQRVHIKKPDVDFTVRAKLVYDPRNPRTRPRKWWLIAKVDRSVVRYYQHQLWELFRIKLTDSAWGPHISLVRGEAPRHPDLWKQYQGKHITVGYSHMVVSNKNHWWLPAFSNDIQEIRKELGLKPLPYVPLHITVGHQVY